LTGNLPIIHTRNRYGHTENADAHPGTFGFARHKSQICSMQKNMLLPTHSSQPNTLDKSLTRIIEKIFKKND